MLVKPLVNQTKSASWQRAGDDAILDGDDSLVALLFDMKMWRIVLAHIM